MTKSWSYLIALSAGHMVKHFYQQGILLLIPFVKASLGLTDVQVGLLGTSRTIFSSAMNIPAGIMADVWRDKISIMDGKIKAYEGKILSLKTELNTTIN